MNPTYMLIYRLITVVFVFIIHEFGHWIVAEIFNYQSFLVFYRGSVAIKYEYDMDLDHPNQEMFDEFSYLSRFVGLGSIICVPFAEYFIDKLSMNNEYPIMAILFLCYSIYEFIKPRNVDFSRELKGNPYYENKDWSNIK